MRAPQFTLPVALRTSVLVAILVTGVAAPASATAILWDNNGPALTNAWNFSNAISDDFSLTTSASVESVRVWLYTGTDTTAFNSLFVKFDSLATLTPSSLTTAFAGNQSCCGTAVYRVDIDFADLVLGAGTHRLQVGVSPITGNVGWSHTGSVQLDRSYINGTPHTVGFFEATDVAFQVNGTALADATVPEPATLSLLGLGLGAAGLRRLRRRARPCPEAFLR